MACRTSPVHVAADNRQLCTDLYGLGVGGECCGHSPVLPIPGSSVGTQGRILSFADPRNAGLHGACRKQPHGLPFLVARAFERFPLCTGGISADTAAPA